MILLFAALMQAPPAQHFPRVDAPGGMVHQLRAEVDRACANPTTLDRVGLLAREDKLAADAHDGHPSASTWTTLGCARAALAGDGAISRPGLLMDAGKSWAHGAERALLLALAQEPADVRAAEVLGVLALNDLEPDDLKASATAIAKAVAAGGVSRGALRACDELAMRIKDHATAQRCATLGLTKGLDSTWHLIRLAQLAFRESDTTNGVKYFLTAMSAAHDSIAHDEVNWHLQWFLSPGEQSALAVQADSNRRRFVRDRLAERDIKDGRPPGARLAEHFGRLEYVLTNFRLSLSRIARDGHGLIGSEPLNQWPSDTERAFCEPGLIPALPFRDYSAWQDRIDDRGVVWLRYGKPDKRVAATPTCDTGAVWDYDPSPDKHKPRVLATNVREIWLYEIDGSPIILNFEAEKYSGSVEATRLVTGVLGSYMCNVDQKRCNLSLRSIAASKGAGTQLHPEDIEHIRQEDREFISVATTDDDNSPRGERNVRLAAQMSHLWDPLSLAPIALVTYALPVKDLAVQGTADKRTTLLDFELRQWNPASDRYRDTSFSKHFVLPDTNVKRPNVVGFLVLPATTTMSVWSLFVTQPDQRLGRNHGSGGVGDGPLVLSDIVLGAESQGLSWNLHNVSIPLAPTAVLARKEPVALYYQIKAQAARTDLRTTVALFKYDGLVPRDTAALQVTFDQLVNAGVNEVAPSLDVSHMDTGRYALEVRISDASGAVITRRRVDLDVE